MPITSGCNSLPWLRRYCTGLQLHAALEHLYRTLVAKAVLQRFWSREGVLPDRLGFSEPGRSVADCLRFWSREGVLSDRLGFWSHEGVLPDRLGFSSREEVLPDCLGLCTQTRPM